MGINAVPAATIAAACAGMIAGTLTQSAAATAIEAALDTLSTPANLTAQIAALIAADEALAAAIKVFTIRGTGATTASLPTTGIDGDVWVIGGAGYAWFSGAWHNIGNLKGDPGLNASEDLIFSVANTFGPGELLIFVALTRAMTVSAASSLAGCRLRVAPQNAFAVAVKRNGVAWATINWASGQVIPASFVFAAGGSTAALAASDLIEFFAPATADAFAAYLVLALAGA